MTLNDPKSTGGMFLGRRPGTAPVRLPVRPGQASGRRRALDSALAAAILVVEALLAFSLWGAQPFGWLWLSGQVEYHSASSDLALVVFFGGVFGGLILSLVALKRLDHAWKLVRRAAGHEQAGGALERIFVVSFVVSLVLYAVYFLFVADPYAPIVPPRT